MLARGFDVVKGKRLEAIEFDRGMSGCDFERVALTFEDGIMLRFRVSGCPDESWINVSLDSKGEGA